MRLAIPTGRTQLGLAPRLAWGWTLGVIAAAGTGMAAANLTHDRLFHNDLAPSAVEARKEAADKATPTHDKATTVVLSGGKFQSAGIKVEPVAWVDMPKEVGVPGRIEADPNRRVDIRPRASGVVRSIPVLPGTQVKKGDPLVVLDSPDVGSARLLVRERQRALATVRVEAAWKAEVAANTEAMIQKLHKGEAAADLTKLFLNKKMGASRGTLISAFAELEIAAHEQEKQAYFKTNGITGEHLLFVAQHTREGAQAKFEAALETVGFEVAQQDLVAKQMVRNAEEMVVDAAQRLRILGVTEDINDLLAHPERASALPSGAEDLTAYPIVAPFDGTVVSTSTVISQRVEPTDTLFVLADLSKVYVVANIPESNFAALPGLGGGTVRLSMEAYPDREFVARMLYTGAEVDPVTRTVRLVAEADNPDGLFKLGMFARIVLDTKTVEKTLTVPIASIEEVVEGKPVVFVPGDKEGTFVTHPVKLGRKALGRQVVLEGLKAGEKVVVANAFLLKSELILQNESDEK